MKTIPVQLIFPSSGCSEVSPTIETERKNFDKVKTIYNPLPSKQILWNESLQVDGGLKTIIAANLDE